MKQTNRRMKLAVWWMSSVLATFGLMALNAYFVRVPPMNDLIFILTFSFSLPTLMIFIAVCAGWPVDKTY